MKIHFISGFLSDSNLWCKPLEVLEPTVIHRVVYVITDILLTVYTHTFHQNEEHLTEKH